MASFDYLYAKAKLARLSQRNAPIAEISAIQGDMLTSLAEQIDSQNRQRKRAEQEPYELVEKFGLLVGRPRRS